LSGRACAVGFRAQGCSWRHARGGAFVASFIAARAASRNVARVGMRFACRAQATTAAALLGFQGSAMVLFTGGATCGRLTIHPSGRRTGAA